MQATVCSGEAKMKIGEAKMKSGTPTEMFGEAIFFIFTTAYLQLNSLHAQKTYYTELRHY